MEVNSKTDGDRAHDVLKAAHSIDRRSLYPERVPVSLSSAGTRDYQGQSLGYPLLSRTRPRAGHGRANPLHVTRTVDYILPAHSVLRGARVPSKESRCRRDQPRTKPSKRSVTPRFRLGTVDIPESYLDPRSKVHGTPRGREKPKRNEGGGEGREAIDTRCRRTRDVGRRSEHDRRRIEETNCILAAGVSTERTVCICIERCLQSDRGNVNYYKHRSPA